MGASQSAAASPAAQLASRQLVSQAITQYPVAIFSKSYCPYCVTAKKVLQPLVKPQKLYILELDGNPDGSNLQAYLGSLTGARTVPRVFIGGKCVGGGNEVKALNASGKLRGLLDSAGAL